MNGFLPHEWLKQPLRDRRHHVPDVERSVRLRIVFRRETKSLVMVTYNEMMIEAIVEDDSLTRDQKIQKLRLIETEARGLQRAASESAMNADDGLEDSLRMVRKALSRLGADEPRKGAASL